MKTFILLRRQGESITFYGAFDSRSSAMKSAKEILNSENVQENFDEPISLDDILSDWTSLTDGYEDFTVIETEINNPTVNKTTFQSI